MVAEALENAGSGVLYIEDVTAINGDGGTLRILFS